MLCACLDKCRQLGLSAGKEDVVGAGQRGEISKKTTEVAVCDGVCARDENVHDFCVVTPASKAQIAGADHGPDCSVLVHQHSYLGMEDTPRDSNGNDFIVPSGPKCSCLGQRRRVTGDIGEDSGTPDCPGHRGKRDGLEK